MSRRRVVLLTTSLVAGRARRDGRHVAAAASGGAAPRGRRPRRDDCRYRYEWEPVDGGESRFGFEGELLESAPPYRTVTTERMIGMPGQDTVNELTLTPGRPRARCSHS